MKITGPGQVKAAAAARKKSGAGGAGFALHNEGEAPQASTLTGTGPLAAMSAMLSLQEVPDPVTGRKRAILRAEDMLDMLEDIRVGLLTGSISETKLRALTRLLRDRRGQMEDPDLAGVLDEIELRAEVELAKLESR